MLIRARGKDGTFRLDLQANQTVLDLKKLLEAETSVPHGNISVNKFREKSPLKDSATIQSCLQHGDMVEFSYDTTQFKSKQEKEEERKAQLRESDDLNNLGLRERKKHWTLNEYLDLVNQVKVTIKHQKYAISSTAYLDEYAGQSFQHFLAGTKFQFQRFGFLYGVTTPGKKPQPSEEEKKKASKDENFNLDDDYQDVYIHVIYEPKQESTPTGFTQLEDPIYNDRADTLAAMLGMKKVGWIFSHDGQREYPLLGPEILKAAEFQSKYGPSFVTITACPDEEGKIVFEAYQVSKQCVELWEKGLLEPHPTNPEFIITKKQVEIERKMTNEIDALLLVSNVAIASHQGNFLVGFPPRNRPGNEALQSMDELKQVLLERKKQKFVDRVSDFDLLLFLTDYLSLTSDFPDLCEAICSKNNARASGFEALINAYCGIN
nr:unnamed protein product [Naegleria fowleri]